MNSKENPQTRFIQQQNQYIRQLEEQLAVCEEKAKAQELLIGKLNQALGLFAEELSRTKTGKKGRAIRRNNPV